MQGLIGLLGRVRERPPSGSAPAPGAAGASELREEGWGGLHSAAASGDLARLQRRWWWKRFRINGRDAKKQTPLHLACANGHADVIRFLAGKKCQLNPRDNSKTSPLMKAVEHQHKDCVAILLEHGANPDLRGAGGNTALHLAATIPSKSLVELLLEHNAHIDAQNEMGYTPLTVAITEHCEEMVEFLLQKGADVHAQDRHERTTLMIAVAARNVNVIRLLLRLGADISHKDVFGQTALSYARLSGYSDNQWEEYVNCERTGECSAGGTEGPAVLHSSCSGTTADFPLGAPAVTGAGVLPAAGAEQEEDDDSPFDSETDSEGPRKGPAGVLLPAADGHGARTQSVAEERGNGVLPAAGAEQEEDDDSPFDSETDSEGPRKGPADVLLPAADGHGARTQSVAEERGNGVLPAAGAEQEEDDSPFDSETDSEGPRKGPAGVLLPAADGHGARTQSVAEERGNGVLPAAGAEQEEDDDSPFDSETDSEGPRKGPAGVLLPAADGHGARTQSVAEERGNGVLPAAGAEQEEDDDSPFDSETDSEGPRKGPADVLLPAADGHGARTQSVAEERGNGVLPAAGAEQEEDDSPFDSETDSEGPRKGPAGVLLPAADGHGARTQSVAEERGNGVLPAAGAEQEEDDDSPFDSETDSEGPRKGPAGVLLPAADGHGARTQSVAEERGNGVLPAAGAEQEEDDDSPFDSETDSEGPRKGPAGVLLPAADGHGARTQSVAEERGNGVLPAAGAEQEEDDDSPFDSETDSEGPRKGPAGVLLPAADGHGARTQSVAEERGNGVLPVGGAKQLEDFDSSSENEVTALGREERQLKKDASTQADCRGDRQRWVRQLQQGLANALKKNSLAEASLEAKKRYSRDLQEQKLQLQKELDRSKAKLQELKERRTQTECYAESLKKAIKNKKRELTTSRNLQGLLVTSSRTAAIPELEERVQRLQVGKARLEATAQQQAKTIEALEKVLQASASARKGLEDLITGFQTTRTAKEHQHRQRGSESKEVKRLAKMKCRSEALLDEMRGRNVALEEERTRLKMLLEGLRTMLMAYAGRESQLSSRVEMKNSCSEVANEVGKQRRKSQLNLQHG